MTEEYRRRKVQEYIVAHPHFQRDGLVKSMTSYNMFVRVQSRSLNAVTVEEILSQSPTDHFNFDLPSEDEMSENIHNTEASTKNAKRNLWKAIAVLWLRSSASVKAEYKERAKAYNEANLTGMMTLIHLLYPTLSPIVSRNCTESRSLQHVGR